MARADVHLNIRLPGAREASWPEFLSKKDRPRRTGAVVSYQGKRYILERWLSSTDWLAVEFPNRYHVRAIPDSKLKGAVEYYR